MDRDLEGPKTIQLLASDSYLPVGSGWILAVRPSWNAISLINMVTSYHRGLPFPGTRCSHVCLEDFGRLSQFLSLLSYNLIVWCTWTFQRFHKMNTFKTDSSPSSQYQVPFWISSHMSFIFSFSKLPRFNLQTIFVLPFFHFLLDILLWDKWDRMCKAKNIPGTC